MTVPLLLQLPTPPPPLCTFCFAQASMPVQFSLVFCYVHGTQIMKKQRAINSLAKEERKKDYPGLVIAIEPSQTSMLFNLRLVIT